MTQPVTRTTTLERTSRAVEARELLDELLDAGARREDDTIAGLVLDKTQDVIAKHRELVEASIKLTFPEDWVVYPTRDGHKLCYLQDVGCQRIRALWGISFDRTDLMRDMIEERIEDDEDVHFQYIARVGGECSVTGEASDELGSRLTSDGLFKIAWHDAKNEPAERARLKANVRKAALANGQGRLVRKFTGMNLMPIEILAKYGMDTARCRGIKFESGTKGGTGGGASEPQLRRIAGLACMEGHVEGCAKSDYGKTLESLKSSCTLSSKDASRLMDDLQNQKAPMSKADFWKRAGYKAPEKAAVEPAKTEAPKADEPPAERDAAREWDPETQNCPACSRTPELVKSNGHAKGCPYTPGAA